MTSCTAALLELLSLDDVKQYLYRIDADPARCDHRTLSEASRRLGAANFGKWKYTSIMEAKPKERKSQTVPAASTLECHAPDPCSKRARQRVRQGPKLHQWPSQPPLLDLPRMVPQYATGRKQNHVGYGKEGTVLLFP